MSPGEVPRKRISYARYFVVLGITSAVAGMLAFLFGLETRLGYAWYAYPLKFSLASAANFLYAYGVHVAVVVPVLLVAACIRKLRAAKKGRASIVLACFGALVLWSFLSGAMFFVLFITHIYSGTVRPDGGMVLPALLPAVGYVLIGCGMVIWGFSSSEVERDTSANSPVNADARANAVQAKDPAGRAGYWGR